jgi:hypothetical protein
LKAELLGLCNAKKVLKKDAVPTLNLKHNSEESTFTSARAKRKTKRARKHVIRDIVTEHENKVRIIQIENRHTDDNTEATIQTVLTTSTELDVTFEENKKLKGNIKQLREQLAVCHKKLSYFHKIQQATKPRHNCRQCRVLSILKKNLARCFTANKQVGVVKVLMMHAANKYVNIPAKVMQTFFRTRMFIRMKQKNVGAKSSLRSYSKKMNKIVSINVQ